MSPATLGASPGMTIRARAWMLDAVLDIYSHPQLVNTNRDEISHEYVKSMFESCESYLAYTMKGLNLISFSMPKHQSTLMSKAVVPVAAILHGTHEISLHTVQAMFGRSEGLCTSWTPLYLGPGTQYRALEDHAMYKNFLQTSSTLIP